METFVFISAGLLILALALLLFVRWLDRPEKLPQYPPPPQEPYQSMDVDSDGERVREPTPIDR